MKYYNPMCSKYVVKTTFQMKEYIGHIAWRVRGPVCGAAVLDLDFLETDDQEAIDAYVINDCEFMFDHNLGIFSAVLRNRNGDELIVDGDSEEFRSMIVKIEIAGQY